MEIFLSIIKWWLIICGVLIGLLSLIVYINYKLYLEHSETEEKEYIDSPSEYGDGGYVNIEMNKK